MARTQVLIAAILFGTTGTAQALGPDGSTPMTVGASRILIGGSLLAAMALASGGFRGRWPLGQVLLAGAGVAVYQLAFFQAVADTGVAVGAIVAIGSGPVFAGILERVLDGAWPGRTWLVATALATTGVAVLSLASATDASLSAAGIGLALVSGLGYATYTIVAKRLLRLGHTPVAVMGASFGLGAVLLLPVLLLGDTAWLHTPDGLALALYLGIVPTALAYSLFARGLRSLDASEVTTLVLAEPLTATVLGVVVLDERVGTGGLLGAVLILAGLAVLALPRPRLRQTTAGTTLMTGALRRVVGRGRAHRSPARSHPRRRPRAGDASARNRARAGVRGLATHAPGGAPRARGRGSRQDRAESRRLGRPARRGRHPGPLRAPRRARARGRPPRPRAP